MGSGSDKKKKQKATKNNMKNSGGGKAKDGGRSGGGGKNITDDRFASAQSDPRFMEAPKKRSKVEIDSRFSRVLTDKRFNPSNARIDKRGKPKNNDNNAATSLSHYYRLQQQEDEKKASPIKEKEEEEEEEDNGSESESDEIGDETESESEKSDENVEDSDDDVQSVDESSSTSTGSDSDSDGQFTEEEEDDFLQPEANVPEIDKETKRLAVVNLDWSQVRAVDLYVLLSSCLPKGGQIVSVAVYPSEFGLKRMEEEAVHGPVGLFDDEEEESDDEEDDEIDNTKLRAYELSRLRYYYAVVECDSIATADYLYKTCDGIEFERSANKLDMRFIPDSMEFKHQPRDIATEAPADYEGVDFQTQALQHSNIHLTWDEDEPQRVKTLKRKLNDGQLAELELKEFLASDESESDEEDNVDDTEDKSLKKCNKRDKYRALVQSGDGSDEDGEDDSDDHQDMEVTFSTGLEDISKRILEKKNKEAETVWEAYLRKRKEKKRASKKGSKYSSSEDEGNDHTDQEQIEDFFDEEPSAIGSTKKQKSGEETAEEAEASRAELELLTADDNGGASLKGYNLKVKKNKGKKGKGVPDESKIPTFDDEDPRFSAVFTSPLFAIDPTDPQFKRSATYVRQVAKKQKIGDKKNVEQTDHFEIPDEASMNKREKLISDEAAKRKEKNELSSLVKSIKMKSHNLSLASRATVPQKRTTLQHKAKRQK